ncbi:MAG: type II toxin-antitoxin system RelE/ParE family toxin [Solirubrobacterales bacterium]
MAWEVEYTDEFESWWDGLTVAEQKTIDAAVRILQSRGPVLGRPLVDTISGSRHANMKELRPKGAVRVLFAFDPRRTAILLIGGNKTGRWRKWYAEMIPVADKLYDEHLAQLRAEGAS